MNNKYVIAFTCKMYNDDILETYAGPGLGGYHTSPTTPFSDFDRAFKFDSFKEAKKFYNDYYDYYKEFLDTKNIFDPCIKKIELSLSGYLKE